MWPWLPAAHGLVGRGAIQLSAWTLPLRTRPAVLDPFWMRCASSAAVQQRPLASTPESQRRLRLSMEPVTRADLALPKPKRVYYPEQRPRAYGPRGRRSKPRPQPQEAKVAVAPSRPVIKKPAAQLVHAPERDWAQTLSAAQLARPPSPFPSSSTADFYSFEQFLHLLPPGTPDPPTPALLMRSFLDAQHGPARRYNAHALIALYHAARGSRKDKMAARHYSLLIALFGALSVLTSAYSVAVLPPAIQRAPVAPVSALVQMVPRSYETEHWKFISFVVADKKDAGLALGYIDHYWLMREALADGKRMSTEQKRLFPDEADAHLWRARAHYGHIKHAARHPLVHVDFLAALIASGVPAHVDHALSCLQFLLRDAGGLDTALQRILWQLLLTQSAAVSAPPRDGFLAELRRVVRRAKEVSPIDRRSHTPVKTVVINTGEVFRDIAPPTLDDAYGALTDTLFSAEQVERDGELTRWAREEANAVFKRPPAEAWQLLALLGAASPVAAEIEDAQMPELTGGQGMLRARRWVFVSALATLLRDNPGQEARGTVAALWNLWLSVSSASPTIPPAVERAVMLAFVRVAGLTAHTELVEDIVRALTERPELRRLLLPHEDFVRTGPFGDTGRAGAALELGAAFVLCCAPRPADWPALQSLVAGADLVSSTDGWNNYANQLVRTLLRVRPALAPQLYNTLLRAGVVFADQAVVEIVQCPELLELALQLHNDRGHRMPATKVAAMLVALTRGLFRLRVARVDANIMLGLVAAFWRAEYRPEPGSREHAHFRWTLITAARSGAHAEAVDLVCKRLRANPRSGQDFPTKFFLALAGVLLKQRQFRHAARLLRAIPPAHPARPRVANLVIARMSKASARAVARTVSARSCANSRLRRLLRAARFSIRRPDPCSTLLLRQLAPAPAQLRLAVQLLVRAGRARAADRFYRAAVATTPVDRKTSTAMGNALLGARLRPRRKRRLFRQIRAVVEKLDELPAFAPDRVTLNVLLKAVVHWDLAIGVLQLRVLFNRLLAAGYPGTPLDEQGAPPLELGRVGAVMQNVQAQRMLYPRHVRPLYRTLITAFRARGDQEAVRHLLTVLAHAREAWEAQDRVRLIRGAMGRRGLWHTRRRAVLWPEIVEYEGARR
ncbi:hypothetical protein AURDEDRAFT_183207 [Auricularia subglabra TFB-10046 SS5]|nr:hypothetical protein AURDEDRAFT_183207 [Auricularia subglabra TFB-10046 SS5]